MTVTLLGRKKKQGNLISDFHPDESDRIMLDLVRGIKESLKQELEEEREHDGERIKNVSLTAPDGSVNGRVSHVPIDYFGEKQAEIRAVLSIKADKHPAVRDAISKHEFEVAVN